MRDPRDIVERTAQRVHDIGVERHNEYVESSLRGFTALAPTRKYWHELAPYDREWERQNLEPIILETLRVSGWFDQK